MNEELVRDMAENIKQMSESILKELFNDYVSPKYIREKTEEIVSSGITILNLLD